MFRNIGTILGAFVVSVILWFHVVLGDVYEYTLNVPIVIKDLPEGMIVVGTVPSTIPVKFEGRGKQLLMLQYGHPSISIRARKTPGKKRYDLSPAAVKIPIGVTVQNISLMSPSSFDVEYDRIVEKKLRIIPQIHVKIPPGYLQTNQVSVIPESILVKGPNGFVRGLRYVKLDSLTLVDVSEDVRKTLRPVLPNTPKLTYSPKQFEVFLRVRKVNQQ